MATSISCPIRNAVMDPPMVHSPWPKMLAKAACMSGTPRSLPTVTHQPAGARLIAR